jgi:DNA-binding transcriptional ArsR family regulator
MHGLSFVSSKSWFWELEHMNGLTALGDQSRVKIIEMLAVEGPLAAGAISQRFSISAPAISQHLKVLKDAGLVRVTVDGQRRIYELEQDGFVELTEWLNRIQRFWSGSLDKLGDEVRKADELEKRTKN